MTSSNSAEDYEKEEGLEVREQEENVANDGGVASSVGVNFNQPHHVGWHDVGENLHQDPADLRAAMLRVSKHASLRRSISDQGQASMRMITTILDGAAATVDLVEDASQFVDQSVSQSMASFLATTDVAVGGDDSGVSYRGTASPTTSKVSMHGDASKSNAKMIVGMEYSAIVTDEAGIMKTPSAVLDFGKEHVDKDVDREASPRAQSRTAAVEEAKRILSCVPPFSYLSEEERDRLANEDVRFVSYSAGEMIIRQGSPDRDVYVLAKGRVMLISHKRWGGKNDSIGGDGGRGEGGAGTLGGFGPGGSPLSFLGYLDAPAFFGEREALFETSRKSQVVSGGGGGVTAYRIDGERFQQLFIKHSAFRLKLALGIRNGGLFGPIETFVALIRRAVALDKQMDFDSILSSYRRITPAIHARLHSQSIDVEGWTYAIRRLPDTVTSTYVYLLSNAVPMPFMNENFDLAEIAVSTAARRRQAFAIDSGKLLIIVREKFSDVLDFMSLLCAHVHESAKLRLRLTNPASLDVIHACLWSSEKMVKCGNFVLKTPLFAGVNGPASQVALYGCDSARQGVGKDHGDGGDSETAVRFHRRGLYRSATLKEQARALSALPLSEDEIGGLRSLWPKDFLYRIWDIVALHENIQVRGDFSPSYVEASDRWAESIRGAVISLLSRKEAKITTSGDEETGSATTRIGSKLPSQSSSPSVPSICITTGLITHIISSNTTSVKNLLSPYIRKHAPTIHSWGLKAHPEIENLTDISESDKLCALSDMYRKAYHPRISKEQEEFDSLCIKTLRHTELTGIQVDLFDLDALETVYEMHGIEPDPYLAPYFFAGEVGGKKSCDEKSDNSNVGDGDEPSRRRRRLLVNIDYAFGRQAEQIISALCLLFGPSISSIGVMGKAGGLQGRRGDIIVADFLVHQEGDHVTLIDNEGLNREALAKLSGGRDVWSGGVLTVLGTLMQDNSLLQYYKKLYGCVSLEMEGSFYAREIRRYKKLGLLSEDMHQRFLYYVSDTPLGANQTETLSQDMGLSELIPPQYAVTRELLRLVLK